MSTSTGTARHLDPLFPLADEADARWRALADGAFDDAGADDRLDALLGAVLASRRLARAGSATT